MTPVETISAASTKNCHGSSESFVLIEVPEFIVEAFLEAGIGRRGRFRRCIEMPRPFDGGEADGYCARGANQIRKQPRDTIEARVERRPKHFLAAVIRHEPMDDFVVRFALVDEGRDFAAHLVRRGAGVLPAFGNVGMTAAAGADDLVLKPTLEIVPGVKGCP